MLEWMALVDAGKFGPPASVMREVHAGRNSGIDLAHQRPNPLGLIILALRGIGRYLRKWVAEPVARAYEGKELFSRFNAMSDDELKAFGLERQDIARLVYDAVFATDRVPVDHRHVVKPADQVVAANDKAANDDHTLAA